MKRILFFNDSLAQGGTEVLLIDLLNHLCTCVHITLLLPEPSPANILLPSLSTAICVRYIYPEGYSPLRKKIGKNLMIFQPRLFTLWRGLKTDEYDEVVCFKECFYASLFSRLNTPTLLWIHNILYKHSYQTHALKEKIAVWLNKKQLKASQKSYNNYDTVVCVSDTCKKIYIDILHDGNPPVQDIRVVYNAIDLGQVLQKSQEQTIEYASPCTNFVVLTRDSPEKRNDRIFTVVARLKQEGYHLHVYILGDGLQTEDTQAALHSLDIADSITIMGRIANPFPYIRASDWLLCVSERESFSLSILEAMALGIPCISTNCGGPADILANGKYGILVDNSTEGVYNGLKMVLEDDTQRSTYIPLLQEATSRFCYTDWLQAVDDLLSV